MRTLHLIGSKSLGGAENFFLRFTDALKDIENIEVYVGIRRGSKVESSVTDKMRSFSLPFYTVWDPISKYAISRLIKKLKPDIVQTYMSRATRLTHISSNKVVHIARLGGYYGLHGFRHAHAWIGNTKGICDYLIKNGFNKERVFHISNFVELAGDVSEDQKNNLKQKLNIPKGSFVILTPARFVSVKGHEVLLKALRLLIHDSSIDKNLKVILLGDGPLKKKLYSLGNELGINKYIIWPGWQNDVGAFYSIADLIVFPSLKMETLGNVVLEAWSYKKPLVCTRFRGALEITKDMEDSIHAECGDAVSLYKAIKKAMKDPSLCNYIAENGYNKVKNKFNKEVILKQYVDVYNYLLEKI